MTRFARNGNVFVKVIDLNIFTGLHCQVNVNFSVELGILDAAIKYKDLSYGFVLTANQRYVTRSHCFD